MDCKKCGNCCNHIALEIDAPKWKEDYNHILWYLLHENVRVFIEDNEWYLEFLTRCKAFDKNNDGTLTEDELKEGFKEFMSD